MLEAPRATVREEAVGGGDVDEGRRGWGYVALAATRGGRRDDSGVIWNEISILFPERKKKKKKIEKGEKTEEKIRKGREVRNREKILARATRRSRETERTIRVPLLTALLLSLLYCCCRRNCLASAALYSSLFLPSPLSLSLSLSLFCSLPLSISLSLSVPQLAITRALRPCDHASGLSREILADDVAMDTAGSGRERRLPRRARNPSPFRLPSSRAPSCRRRRRDARPTAENVNILSRAAPAMRPLA